MNAPWMIVWLLFCGKKKEKKLYCLVVDLYLCLHLFDMKKRTRETR